MSLFKPGLGDGYYDDEGQWQRNKFCFVDCGEACTCGPPGGLYYSPSHDKRISVNYPTPDAGWTCFHCGENFPGNLAGHKMAQLHFGTSIYDEPKCQISAHRLRDMEAQLRRYRDEDTDLHREISRLQSDHALALRREEELGYARGLKDGRDLNAAEDSND